MAGHDVWHQHEANRYEINQHETSRLNQLHGTSWDVLLFKHVEGGWQAVSTQAAWQTLIRVGHHAKFGLKATQSGVNCSGFTQDLATT